MAPIDAVSFHGTFTTFAFFTVYFGVFGLNLFAVSKIIAKAGYSARWILVPLTPVALWLFTGVNLVLGMNSRFFNFEGISNPTGSSALSALGLLELFSIF